MLLRASSTQIRVVGCTEYMCTPKTTLGMSRGALYYRFYNLLYVFLIQLITDDSFWTTGVGKFHISYLFYG